MAWGQLPPFFQAVHLNLFLQHYPDTAREAAAVTPSSVYLWLYIPP